MLTVTQTRDPDDAGTFNAVVPPALNYLRTVQEATWHVHAWRQVQMYHGTHQWHNRTHPRIHAAFAQLWQTESLRVNHACVSIAPPVRLICHWHGYMPTETFEPCLDRAYTWAGIRCLTVVASWLRLEPPIPRAPCGLSPTTTRGVRRRNVAL